MLTLRTKPVQRREFWIAAPIAGAALLVAAGYLASSKLVPAIAFAAFAVVVLGLEAAAVRCHRIVVTPDEIRVRDLTGPNRSAARAAVTSIHIYAYWTTLADGTGTDLLRSRPGWTEEQLLSLAEYLVVPLYDHRTHHGLAHSATGRLVARAGQPRADDSQEPH